MFAFGQGVPQNYDQAMKWYRKSADQGTAAAQHNVGLIYQQGLGVPQDFDEAMRWYLKAAEAGHAEAALNIGIIYSDGHGERHSMVLSGMWFYISAAFNDARAVECLDSISNEMTSDQIAKARHLATKWLAEHQQVD